MVYAPGAPRRQIVPRSMYQAPAPTATPPQPTAAPGAVRQPGGRNYAPLNAPAGLNNARPAPQARAPGAPTPIAAGVTPQTPNPQAQAPGVHPVAANNAFGAVGATPGDSFRQDPVATENAQTSGGFRQQRVAGRDYSAMTPTVNGGLATTDQNPAQFMPVGGFSIAKEANVGATEGKAAAPRLPGPGPSLPGAAPHVATAQPTATGASSLVSTTDGSNANAGVGTNGSGLRSGEQGTTPEQEATDAEAARQRGGVDQPQSEKDLLEKMSAQSGESQETINALWTQNQPEGWGRSSYHIDPDTGQIESLSYYRSFSADDPNIIRDTFSGDYVYRDPKTGETLTLTQQEDGSFAAFKEVDVKEIDMNTARKAGEAEVSNNGSMNDLDFNKIIEEMKSIGQSPEDKKALEDRIALDRQRNQYETSRALLAGMEGGARAGLSADASVGRSADVQIQGGLAGAENESRARLENAAKATQAQMQALQLQAAMAGQKMSQAQQIELMKLQSRLQKQYAAYMDALNTPTPLEALGSMFGNFANAGLNILTFGGASALEKKLSKAWG